MKAEFADREVFGSLLEAKVLGAEYQRYWNQERLHSGIGYNTPAEFAAVYLAHMAGLPTARREGGKCNLVRERRNIERYDGGF